MKNVGLLSANFLSERLGLPNRGLPCLWTLRICIWCHSRTLTSHTTFDLIFPCGKKNAWLGRGKKGFICVLQVCNNFSVRHPTNVCDGLHLYDDEVSGGGGPDLRPRESEPRQRKERQQTPRRRT